MTKLINRIELEGNLARDIVVNSGKQSGKPYTFFSIINNKLYYNCKAFGETAYELGALKLKAGELICVIGALRPELYKDRNGVEKTVFSIYLDSFQVIGRNAPQVEYTKSIMDKPTLTEDDIPF